MIDPAQLEPALKDFLPRQRWFRVRGEIAPITVSDVSVLKGSWPILLRLTAETASAERYNVLVGVRPLGQHAGFLEGHPESLLGEVETDLGRGFAYDALRDAELALVLFERVAPDLPVPRHARPLGTEQSNTSLVMDDHYVLKVFRVISAGASLDVEVTAALGDVGFAQIAPVVGIWNEHGSDLAVVQEFLAGGSEGWSLALTSVRDLLGSGGDPAQTGGDFAAEAERLGQMTAEMHNALGEAFGFSDPDPGGWADLMMRNLERTDHSGIDRKAAKRLFERLRRVEDPGPSIRTHGDFHLGQVVRTDQGWYVLDFEGEPVRPIEERRIPISPFKDIAGMTRSIQYASRLASIETGTDEVELARSWEQRNRQAFLDGYVASAHERGGLLPSDRQSLETLLVAFEVDKAIYEVSYETLHRADWVTIPLDALKTLLK